jgi:hypothetical protein
MKRKFSSLIATLMAATMAGGCGAAHHREAVQDDSLGRMTVGTVQKEIHIGMSGAEVAATIGSPNVVSTDASRNEVWIYDRISTDVSYSNSAGGVLGLIFGPVGGAGGVVLGSAQQESGATSRSQRTLTVIINFDADDRVSDFAYHASRF